ncbi:PAS domain S-box protein [Planktothrix sp. FACHB-1355]|uniref:histidine kinase n=1 Tax=Aerosakkonema funiforme FACHB-1375 TaxID=2949571 RepID=A0A926VGR5_9CYAN|nr:MULTISPECIES: PAS domain S-box protein [Oscillatoriales]MBD2183497.1 PAS domain S-box protein [Aerosakkonema funiforme FACHB-1375]MBD3558218.1 PAS domain S-box protein [Planktothrix sp. FACHB-1355]
MKKRAYRLLLPYIVAIASTGIALLLTLWLEPLMSRTIGAFFYIAVIVSTWYGGIRPGFVTVVLSILALNYYFIPPLRQFWGTTPDDVLRLGIFTVVALMIAFIGGDLQESKRKVEQLSRKLQQESAERLKTALNAAQMGMWDWDIVTGKITWSPEHEMLLGLAPGSFDGRYETFDACLYPEDREGLEKAIEQSLNHRIPYQHEYRVVWADGSVHWVEGRGKAFYNEQGQPVRMSGTIMAIDARKEAVEKLLATSLQLRHQFEQQQLVSQITQRIRNSLNLPEILQTTVDEVREYLKTDRVIIFQFTPAWGGTIVVESVADEWMPLLPLQIFDPCIGEEYVEPFKKGLVTAKSDIYNSGISPCHVEFLAQLQVRANLVVPVMKGDRLWGLLAAHHCEAPRQWEESEIDLLQQLAAQVSIALQQSELFQQVQTELAERKQAEAALRENEALLRLFVQYAPAGIAMFDRDMRYMMASQRWVDEYNLISLESLINRSHYDIFPEIPEQWRQIHQRCLAGAIEKCDDDLFVRADGTQQWISWEIHPWYTATGEIGGIILFSVDVTKRKQAEVALQEKQNQIQQQLAEIETIYHSAPIGLSVLDSELRFVRINQRLAEINGLPVEAHIDRTVREIVPNLADSAEQLLHSVLETGEPVLNVEIIGETPAQPGVQRTWVESWLPLKDSDRIIGINIVCEEITDRKQTQLALEQLNAELEQRVVERTAELTVVNDRLLEALLEQQHTQSLLSEKAQLLDLAHDTIVTLDLNLVITFWNQGAERMYGWTQSEALGKESYLLLQTQFPQPLAEIQAQLFERGYWEGELIERDRNNQSLIVASRWVVQKDEMGRPIKILKINNNITARKQVEIALQKYAQEVEDLYNNAPCGYHSLDDDGVIIRINNTELNWLSYTREEILDKKKFIDLITPESRKIFYENFPIFKQQGWIDNLEFEMIGKDGTSRWVSINGTAIKDEAGNFLMSRSTLFDISDRKRIEKERNQAEALLRESEERRRLALDLTHIGFWDLHLPSGKIFWNDNHFTLLGLVPDRIEPNYELWRSHIHPDDLGWVEPLFMESIANHNDYAAEYRVVHPNGSLHWLMGRARAIYDELGQPLRSIGVLLDISDRKLIEEALRQSEEIFRSLSEFSPIGIFLSDVAGKCIYSNPCYQKIVGCTNEEALGDGWKEFIHPDDREWMFQYWSDVVAAGNEGLFNELRYQDRQGGVRYSQVRTAPIKSSDGTIILFVGVVEDITERRKIDQMKKEFISVVSHELRTPLTSIRGSLGLIAGGVYDKKPEKMKQMIDIAARESERLVRLVNDILDLRRLESGQAKFNFQPCAASTLIQQSVNVMRSQAEQNHITLSSVPSEVEVWADPDAIVQILTNLLSNAIKFSAIESTITISAKLTQKEGPSYGVFSVQDQGRGIPEDKLEAIFGQFQQVDASDAREKGGTGLGLAICRNIIEHHGGKIWVESVLNEGSTFYFTLPLGNAEKT